MKEDKGYRRYLEKFKLYGDEDHISESQVRIQNGIPEHARKEISNSLKKLLADTYSTMLTAQNYHWNAKGIWFSILSEVTEEQYENNFRGVDKLANRIRALGDDVPASFDKFQKITSVASPDPDLKGLEMIADLLLGNEIVMRSAREVLPFASDAEDEVTISLVTERLQFHEKFASKLRIFLDN